MVGLVVAILAASAISIVLSTQLAVGPQGPKGDSGEIGPQGLQGLPGVDGVSGLDGVDGADGVDGVDGKDGVNGTDGVDGLDGKSAYEIWLDEGNSGTEQDFLDSLKGEQGPAGVFSIENMSGWLPAPAFDSGWVSNWTDEVEYLRISLYHGLNTTDVFVYVVGRLNQTIEVWENGSVHQFAYGGLFGRLGGGAGVFWVLGESKIELYRLIPDSVVPWHEVRVLIWKVQEP